MFSIHPNILAKVALTAADIQSFVQSTYMTINAATNAEADKLHPESFSKPFFDFVCKQNRIPNQNEYFEYYLSFAELNGFDISKLPIDVKNGFEARLTNCVYPELVRSLHFCKYLEQSIAADGLHVFYNPAFSLGGADVYIYSNNNEGNEVKYAIHLFSRIEHPAAAKVLRIPQYNLPSHYLRKAGSLFKQKTTRGVTHHIISLIADNTINGYHTNFMIPIDDDKLLVYYGAVSSIGESATIFNDLLNGNFMTIPYTTAKDYVSQYWSAYLATGEHDNSVNGNVFEIIIESLLIRTGILPFYTQAELAHIPAAEYDIIVFTKDEYGLVPYCLSLKTSFRERWKQADLESQALKNVYRRAKAVLLTVNIEDADSVTEKINSGDAVAIDKVIKCTTDEIDDLINELQRLSRCEAPSLCIVKDGSFVG